MIGHVRKYWRVVAFYSAWVPVIFLALALLGALFGFVEMDRAGGATLVMVVSLMGALIASLYSAAIKSSIREFFALALSVSVAYIAVAAVAAFALLPAGSAVVVVTSAGVASPGLALMLRFAMHHDRAKDAVAEEKTS